MVGPFLDQNSFSSPPSPGHQPQGASVKGKVMAPAIALMVVALLGLGFSMYYAASALFLPPREMDPQASEMQRQIQAASQGPAAGIVHSAFIAVNLIIIVGAYQMMHFRSWGLGLTATILAMLNFGSCCCALGLPVGIWCLVILLMNDVKAAFASASV